MYTHKNESFTTLLYDNCVRYMALTGQYFVPYDGLSSISFLHFFLFYVLSVSSPSFNS